MSMDWQESARFGLYRGFAVQLCICPLDVIKTQQQAHGGKAYDIFRERGIKGGLYKGLQPQLAKMVLKQAWTWPMITHLPSCFPFSPMGQQIATGLTIATVNAVCLTPFEKIKVQLQLGQQISWEKGWSAVGPNFRKLSVSWIAFMGAQHALRGERKLTTWETMKVGVQTAGIVGLVKAPFDWKNTISQGGLKAVKTSYFRGAPLAIISLIVHNWTSIALLNHWQVSSEQHEIA